MGLAVSCAVMCALSSAPGDAVVSAVHSGPPSGPDTSYCWPTVIVQRADGREPLSGYAQLYRIESNSRDSVRWVSAADFGGSMDLGRAEIAGAMTGRYLIHVTGIYAARPLAEWRPPPGRPTEVAVGIDPWKRPVQVQSFEAWTEWSVVHGNCADSAVVRVRPGKWITPTGERMLHERTVVPAPFRVRSGK